MVGPGVIVGLEAAVGPGVLVADICCGTLVTVGVEALQAESNPTNANTEMLSTVRATPVLVLNG